MLKFFTFTACSPAVTLRGSLRTAPSFSSHSFFGKKIETNLPHGGLNPIHVTPSLTNSQTLGSYFTARMGRIDIEVPNSPFDTSSKGALACYPRRTFYPLGDSPSFGTARSLGPYLLPCSACLPRSLAGIYPYALLGVLLQFPLGPDLCAPSLLFRRPPPQPNYPSSSSPPTYIF